MVTPDGSPFGFSVPDATQQFSVNSIYDVSPAFLGDLLAYIELNPPKIPLAQIQGYISNEPYTATPVNPEQSTTSLGTFVDLTTVGPSLSGLPDGTYIVTWGSIMSTTVAANRAQMGVSVNGGAVDTTVLAATNSPSAVGSTGQRSITVQMAAGSGGSTVVCKYRLALTTPAGTATFGNRYLSAVRVSGP